MSEPEVKGWCPGAYRPMMSGDGLVVRVRPRMARLTAEQALGLCDMALRFGSGVIDLTNRANLQIRGVAEDDHDALLQELNALELLDADPALESRRNILITPLWQRGDKSARLARAVMNHLADLPEMPAKVGFAVDTGPLPVLVDDSADFRFERSDDGIILRADGCARGRPVTETDAMQALSEMADWFAEHRSENRRRMASVLARHALPDAWATTAPRARGPRPMPGQTEQGTWLGAPFGQIKSADLADVLQMTEAPALRVTPWRLFLLETVATDADNFITRADDPLLHADACPGAPFCPQASVETRAVARALAPHVTGSLHVSGCPKSCARRTPADITLTGRNGAFDLVEQGHPWDAPTRTGLTPDTILSGADL